MTKVKLRHCYDGKVSAGMVFDPKDTPTKQSMKDECDVNVIVAKFEQTGVLPNVGPGVFTDVSNMGDYRDALEEVARAQDLFMKIPAVDRAKFDNDPAKFLDFVSDPSNIPAIQDMGFTLVNADGEVMKPVEAVTEPVVEPAAPEAAPAE